VTSRFRLFTCYASKQRSPKDSRRETTRTVSFGSPVHDRSFVTPLKKYRPQVVTLTLAAYPYLTDRRLCHHCKIRLVTANMGFNRSLFWDNMEDIYILWAKHAQIFKVSYQMVHILATLLQRFKAIRKFCA